MQQQETYTCECGKSYTDPQSFNGHKSHCVTHLECTGRLHIRETVDRLNKNRISVSQKKQHTEKDELKLKQWQEAKHTCERCGKLMTEQFGSGRFCSRKCANSRDRSEKVKLKIKNSVRATVSTPEVLKQNELERINNYYDNPRFCIVCGKTICFENRNRVTCSDKCLSTLQSTNSRKSAEKLGGNNNVNGVRGTAHYGTYAGFHCDSSYELAVVIYCLEHDVPIVRNTEGFEYEFNGELHKYYPDFIIKDTYIETKNYWNEQVQSKVDQFPKHLKYSILYYEDIKPCIEYCVQKYGSRFTEVYDRSYPSWIDRNT